MRTGSVCFAAAVLAAVLGGACGGEKKEGPDPKTLEQLLECQKERDRAKTATEMCTKQLDEAKQADGEGVVVRIEGDVLTVTGKLPSGAGGGGSGREPTVAEQRKIYEAIVAQVRGSRASIQKCYVSALKKNEAIQARTINLKIMVTIGPSGGVTAASFAPRISQDFDDCMKVITARWNVGAWGGTIPVEVPVTLQPSE